MNAQLPSDDQVEVYVMACKDSRNLAQHCILCLLVLHEISREAKLNQYNNPFLYIAMIVLIIQTQWKTSVFTNVK